MAYRFNPPIFRSTDTNDSTEAAATLEFYDNGTTTPATVWSDAARTTPLGSTVDTDAAGVPEDPIYLEPGKAYTVYVKDSNGAHLPGSPVNDVYGQYDGTAPTTYRADTTTQAITTAANFATGTTIQVDGADAIGDGGGYTGEKQASSSTDYPGNGDIKPIDYPPSPLFWDPDAPTLADASSPLAKAANLAPFTGVIDLRGKNYKTSAALDRPAINGLVEFEGSLAAYDKEGAPGRTAYSLQDLRDGFEPTDNALSVIRKDATNQYSTASYIGDGFWQRTKWAPFVESGGAQGERIGRRQVDVVTAKVSVPARGGTTSGTAARFQSGDPSLYVGGEVVQLQATTAYVEWSSQTISGTLSLVYFLRSTGGVIEVEIIGGSGSDYIILPLTGGQALIDTEDPSYTSLSADGRREVVFAAGLPSGTYDIRVTLDSGTQANITAYTHSEDGVTTPFDAGADAPLWAASTSYGVKEHVRASNGEYYFNASAAGTSGTTEPTHLSGDASDGTLTWTWMPSSSYELYSRRVAHGSSETEVVFIGYPSGGTPAPTGGGYLGGFHGNDNLVSHSASVGANEISMVTGTPYSGNVVKFEQVVELEHPDAGNATVIADQVMSVAVRAGIIQYETHTTTLEDMDVSLLYAAMLPVLGYENIDYTRVFLNGQSGSMETEVSYPDFLGRTNPFAGETHDNGLWFKGFIGHSSATSGSPSDASDATHDLYMTVSAPVQSLFLNRHEAAGSARLAMNNTSRGDSNDIYGDSAFSSLALKGYLRAIDDEVVTFLAGTVITTRSTYFTGVSRR